MLGIKLICAGRLREKHYIEACREYEKRLSALCRLEIVEIPEESGRSDGLSREGAKILSAIPGGSYAVAMCIEGKEMSSTGLARHMAQLSLGGVSRICFIIGSSEGLADAVKQRADLHLSMSPMTFPHHLARVMVLEQIYRAASINEGSKYHK